MRAPSTTRSASRSPVSAVAERRTGAPCSPAYDGISGGSHSANSVAPRGEASSDTLTTGRPVSRPADTSGSLDGRGGEHEGRRGAVPRADPPQPPQHLRDVRAEDARGRCGTRRRRRTRSPRRKDAKSLCRGSTPRESMSGLVSTSRACRRTQSRSSRGVSPSYVAARTATRSSARTARSWSVASALVGGEVERGRPLGGEHRRQHRQQVGQRLAARRAGRDDHRRARRATSSAACAWCSHGSRTPARRSRSTSSGGHPGRPRRGPAGPGGDVLHVGDALGPRRVERQPLQQRGGRRRGGRRGAAVGGCGHGAPVSQTAPTRQPGAAAGGLRFDLPAPGRAPDGSPGGGLPPYAHWRRSRGPVPVDPHRG